MTDRTPPDVTATTSGAVGLSAVASLLGLCCVGPLTVALFGVPGAVMLARWQPARPYLLSVAGLMLAWAFWRVYRPRPVCADGACPPRPSKWRHAALWASTLILLFAFFAEDILWLFIDPTPRSVG